MRQAQGIIPGYSKCHGGSNSHPGLTLYRKAGRRCREGEVSIRVYGAGDLLRFRTLAKSQKTNDTTEAHVTDSTSLHPTTKFLSKKKMLFRLEKGSLKS